MWFILLTIKSRVQNHSSLLYDHCSLVLQLLSHKNLSFVPNQPFSEMWAVLYGWLTQCSLDSLYDFTKLQSSIGSVLHKIRNINIIDISTLEDLIENFFKQYTKYDALRPSMVTKESYEKAFHDAQIKDVLMMQSQHMKI